MTSFSSVRDCGSKKGEYPDYSEGTQLLHSYPEYDGYAGSQPQYVRLVDSGADILSVILRPEVTRVTLLVEDVDRCSCHRKKTLYCLLVLTVANALACWTQLHKSPDSQCVLCLCRFIPNRPDLALTPCRTAW